MRHPDDKHQCPLLKRDVLWGECWVIQDIRDDNTDMKFAPEPFERSTAKKICVSYRWYRVDEEASR